MQMMNRYALLTTLLFISVLFLAGCWNASLPSNKEELCIGVQCRPQPTTPEEFIPLFAEQLKHYSALAPTLRPDNAVQGFVAIIVTMDKTKAWEVSPDGTFNAISIEEAKKYGETVGYDTEFIFFSKEGKKGIVLTLNENTLKNPALFEKYAHIGTYDLFITYVHELFHNEEQTKRYTPPLSFPTDRDELLKDYEARAARAVILQQLLSAFSSPQTELSFLKKAVATYRAYQKAFPQDAAITQYWDTIEGAAYYVELISSLKVWYPKIQTINDIYDAYGKIAPTVKIIDWAGAVNEGYIIGGLAGILLDHRGQTGRKEATIKQATSAMESLAQYLEKETTPQDIVVVDDTLKDTYATLPNEETELNDEEITNIVTMLKKYKESNTTAYAMLLEQLKTDNLALFEKIQPLLD